MQKKEMNYPANIWPILMRDTHIYIYIYIYIHAYICVHVCTVICIHIYIYLSLCAYIYAHRAKVMSIYICVYIHVANRCCGALSRQHTAAYGAPSTTKMCGGSLKGNRWYWCVHFLCLSKQCLVNTSPLLLVGSFSQTKIASTTSNWILAWLVAFRAYLFSTKEISVKMWA